MSQVQCQKLKCPSRELCSHAVPHQERANCFNDSPKKRTMLNNGKKTIVCPECEIFLPENG